jgi:hypothetical protein
MTSPTTPADDRGQACEPMFRPLFIQFSDCGTHIRKWSYSRFDGATEYAPATHVRRMIRDAVDRPKGVVPASADDYYGMYQQHGPRGHG